MDGVPSSAGPPACAAQAVCVEAEAAPEEDAAGCLCHSALSSSENSVLEETLPPGSERESSEDDETKLDRYGSLGHADTDCRAAEEEEEEEEDEDGLQYTPSSPKHAAEQDVSSEDNDDDDDDMQLAMERNQLLSIGFDASYNSEDFDAEFTPVVTCAYDPKVHCEAEQLRVIQHAEYLCEMEMLAKFPPSPLYTSHDYFPPELVRQRAFADGSVPWNPAHSFLLVKNDLCDQWEDHCQGMRRSAHLSSLADNVVLVKVLVAEARRLEREHLKHKLDYRRAFCAHGPSSVPPCPCCRPEAFGAIGELPDDILYQNLDQRWKRIGANSVREVRIEGQPYDTVRRLANQFIFLEGKQMSEYLLDNPSLHIRAAQQRYIIQSICMPSSSISFSLR
ncbi:hypothetical protein DIPPA_07318 [Diplonema papillatum]|nr:hypothetical protein DIPPA_07318 [Diplonema papillatum]